jgi:putative NIF3 family GTP cyclohydrolase 1 type 2
VWLTGELSHHEILAANAAGTSVILTDHTNTERGYLPVLGARLADSVRASCGKDMEVLISKVDADPLRVV